MDASAILNDLKTQVRQFCERRDWDQYHSAKDIAIGIITEASELLELFRFKDHDEQMEMLKNSELREKISEELGDILFFLLRFSQRFNSDLSDSFKKKMEKNELHYPVHKSKGSNRKYTE